MKNCKTIRPLLSVNRFETGKFCSYWQLPIYPDQSNQKTKFSRNRVRKQIIPLIKLFFNLQVENVVLQLTEIVDAENQHLINVSKDIAFSKLGDRDSLKRRTNLKDTVFPLLSDFESKNVSLLKKQENVSLLKKQENVSVLKRQEKKGASFFLYLDKRNKKTWLHFGKATFSNLGFHEKNRVKRYNTFLYNSKLLNVKIREEKSTKKYHLVNRSHVGYTNLENVLFSMQKRKSEQRKLSTHVNNSATSLENNRKERTTSFFLPYNYKSTERFFISQFFLAFQTLCTLELEDTFYNNSSYSFILSVLPLVFQRRVTKLFLESNDYKKRQYLQIEKIVKKLLTSAML